MGSSISFIRHLWTINHPPEPAKNSKAIRIGLLGASWIAPMAVIIPAKSHPEVIVAAIAARDKIKANAYAKMQGVPIVHESYQALLDDSAIDAIYIPLPNGLHYEWATRALRAGKHVLLEKPSTSNAIEAKALFDFHGSLPSSTRPILLEAFHYRFHPAWQLLLSLVSKAEVSSVHANMNVFKGFLKRDYIRFQYNLAGGALMDMGTCGVSSLRQVFGEEPVECLEAKARMVSDNPEEKCDEGFKGRWRFPNGGVGSIDVDARGTAYGFLPWMTLPNVVVTHKPVAVAMEGGTGEVQECVKSVKLTMFAGPHFWHYVEVVDEHSVRAGTAGEVLKSWEIVTRKTAYTWDDELEEGAVPKLPGDAYWTTYRYMREEFVNRIKGREGSGVWVDGEDSVRQMVVIDEAYRKAGLPIRPTCSFL
jgi:predicted dehydrogenase